MIFNLLIFVASDFWLSSGSVASAKTAQAVYEDPFDQAAGGASLTRASQEGVMFANPALLPFGKKFFRWFGSQFSIIAGKDSVEEARSLAKGGSSGGESSTDEFFDKVFEKPMHFGATGTLSFISNNFGIGSFARFEPDIQGVKHDETGMPLVRARAEAYGGGVMSFAGALSNWFSLGLTGKYMYKTEPDISISLGDENKVNELQSDPQALRDEAEPGTGFGYDVGSLIFLQGNYVDYRLAFKVDDVGNTQFSKEQEEFKQIYHVGTAVTFHNSIDSLHLAIDYRDIGAEYSESLPMRIHAGAKLIIRNYIGLAAGLYQGYPSFGIRADLLLIKAGFTYYAREMGEYAGDDKRELYVVYFGIGI